jgi:hypothetical protein
MENKKLKMPNIELLESDLITRKYTSVLFYEGKNNKAPTNFVVLKSEDNSEIQTIKFQDGAINQHGVNGVMNEDLIAMVIKRLEYWQTTEFKCRENACAITKLEESLMWLRKRTTGRERKGIEGTHKV